MKEIQLTQGKTALVDDEDFEYLNQFKWCADKHGKTFYAIRQLRIGKEKRRLYMHRLITQYAGMTDHCDHNGLNNQRHNLRECTRSQNAMNRGPNPGRKFKGISLLHGKYMARIEINGKRVYIGYYDTEEEAAVHYDQRAKELFGEFVNPNFK